MHLLLYTTFFHYLGNLNYQCLKNVKCSIYSLVPYSDTVQRSGVYTRQKTSKSCTRNFADGYLMSKNLQIHLAYMENWVGYHSYLIYRKISMIRYWIKLLISGDNFIPKKVYIMLKNDADNNITYNGLN